MEASGNLEKAYLRSRQNRWSHIKVSGKYGLIILGLSLNGSLIVLYWEIMTAFHTNLFASDAQDYP